jgi:hypothetical protein
MNYERETRWGKVQIQQDRLDGTYTRLTYEGPRDAVIVAVADNLNGTTQMYEHMFTVESITPVDQHKLRVTCMRSNYAGD